MFTFRFPKKDVEVRLFPPEVTSINSICHNLTKNLFIDQGGFHPIVIHAKLLRVISPKIGNFARAIKRLRDHVCASTDAIASDRSRKTKRPEIYSKYQTENLTARTRINLCMQLVGNQQDCKINMMCADCTVHTAVDYLHLHCLCLLHYGYLLLLSG